MTGFTFNGTTSQSLGLLVTALNPYNSASRRVETIEIPYRNGNLIIDSGTYDNIMVSYEVSVIGNTKTTCDAVNEWLSGSQGYCILSDTVNTEFFRVGYFASSIEYVLTALYREGKATLNFDCFPQKYLNSNTTITRNATSTTETDISGTTFSSHVYPLPIDLKGNTTQEGTPTPSSPQDVHNVSGDNTIKVIGKNLYDPSWRNPNNVLYCLQSTGTENEGIFTLTATGADMRIWEVASAGNAYNANIRGQLFTLENATYTITVSNTTITANYLTFFDANKVSLGYQSFGGVGYTMTFSKTDDIVPSGAEYFTMRLGYNHAIVGTKYSFTVQVEKSATATSYEPYKCITYPINLPAGIELNKIGNYQDYLYKSGNKWYLHKETGKVVLDGSEDIAREQISNSYYKFYVNNIPNVDYGDTNYIPKIMCDKLVAISRTTMYVNTQGITSANNNLQIYTDDTKEMTISEFKTWLGSNNIIAYYGITTPTNTEITDATLLSQLNAINNAMAFETSTTIAQVNNDAPFLLTYTNIGSATVTSNYRGEPIITVNDTGYIYINGASIKVNQVPMTINSQTMQAYNGNINLNNYIELNEFPMLKKGNNDIGSTMALSIVPNYWKL